MGLKRKHMIMRQMADVEQSLQIRLSGLAGKGIEAPKTSKDTLVRKLQADIRTLKNRLKIIADNEKRTEDRAKIKEERAAAPVKEQESAKAEKPKQAPEEGKGKKIKTEKKAAPQKTPEGGKSQKATDSPEEGKAITKN
jgi:hypothetical protein